MPAVSSKQWGLMQAVKSGKSNAVAPDVANDFITNTNPKMRSKFAEKIAAQRKKKSY